MTNDEIARWVDERIDSSLRQSVPREILITAILLLEVAVGLALFAYGIKEGGWVPFTAGSICQAAIAWPISKLLAIRRDNLYLKILPGLIKMADKGDQKKLIYQFVTKLMAKL